MPCEHGTTKGCVICNAAPAVPLIAVVGYGRMGRLHARILRALGAEVVTFDPDPAAGADIGPGDYADLKRFDGAVIATPATELAEAARSFQGVGVRTLIEKPMAMNTAQAATLDPALTSVGYVERFNPALMQLVEHLDRIGPVRHIESRRLGVTRGTNVVADLATHECDVLHLLGFRPTVTRASVTDWHASISWPLGTITVSYLYPVKIRTLEVVGTLGMLALDYQAQTLTLHDEAGATELPVYRNEPLREELRYWLRELDGLADLKDGLDALQFIEQVEAQSGFEVGPAR